MGGGVGVTHVVGIGWGGVGGVRATHVGVGATQILAIGWGGGGGVRVTHIWVITPCAS